MFEKNKLDIKDQRLCHLVDTVWGIIQGEIGGPEGQFDAEHLKEIHRYLFGDFYHWAGKHRGNTLNRFFHDFTDPKDIEQELEKGCKAIKKELLGPYAKDLSKEECVQRLVKHFYALYGMCQ